ncbi:hypothetical protein DFA_02971 [Cavenderia fasciculata]|uniref:Transmembrane protein n=1 Tax=Cavenderia fasciculata TaxID=261658 RepID=F4PG93_CACFS|nr:uncharacterized protein DFA_02971 [Cavenderia fasciculata]EGG24727.1 hypothetical protein DFA_02971 [Cavenderia fasciculata]|eukprot:XP_004362578.1 hypothetical protein DFA_02971 [Cavenderia fasciculata]
MNKFQYQVGSMMSSSIYTSLSLSPSPSPPPLIRYHTKTIRGNVEQYTKQYRCFSERFPPDLGRLLSEQEYVTIIRSYNQTLGLRMDPNHFVRVGLAILIVSAVLFALFPSLNSDVVIAYGGAVLVFFMVYMMACMFVHEAKRKRGIRELNEEYTMMFAHRCVSFQLEIDRFGGLYLLAIRYPLESSSSSYSDVNESNNNNNNYNNQDIIIEISNQRLME